MMMVVRSFRRVDRHVGIADDAGPQRRGRTGETARRRIGLRRHRRLWGRHRARREQHARDEPHTPSNRAHDHIAIWQLPADKWPACMRSSDWIDAASLPVNTSFAP